MIMQMANFSPLLNDAQEKETPMILRYRSIHTHIYITRFFFFIYKKPPTLIKINVIKMTAIDEDACQHFLEFFYSPQTATENSWKRRKATHEGLLEVHLLYVTFEKVH